MVRLIFPTRIQTARLFLEPLKYEDAAEIFYTYASKAEATTFVSWPRHKRIEDTYAFLQYAHQARELHRDYSFAIRTRSQSRLVGSIGILNFNGEIQFGYIISPTQWNRGYATEVCQTMLQLLRQQPGVKRIFTYVAPENKASIKVLTKSGLVEEILLREHLVFPNRSAIPGDCYRFSLPLTRSPQ
jgi:[ribosomal protein S5]-alanine N-acetyltransferase